MSLCVFVSRSDSKNRKASGTGKSDAIDARFGTGRKLLAACGIRQNQSARDDVDYGLAALGSRHIGGASLSAGSHARESADP